MTTPADPINETITTANMIPDKSDPNVKDPIKVRNDEFRARIEVAKTYRRKLVPQWIQSIDFRRGKPFASQIDEDRIVINMDWSLTKSKQAALFSQVPQVRISHPPHSTQEPWVHAFEQRVNDTLIQSGIESAMDEVLPDVINAAGVGAVMVSYEAITQDKQVPSIDLSTMGFPPEAIAAAMKTGIMPDGFTPVPMEVVPEVLDKHYTVSRFSPADLLWPINFSGSNFDQAPWIGRSGRITWAEAVKRFKLTDDDKVNCLGDNRTVMDKLGTEVDREKIVADEMVSFDELFYKEYMYDSAAKSYQTIHHLVFISGKTAPVVDEPWKGQQLDAQNQVIGALRFPIRVLTLTYITDEAIPPSDSAVGRPQVNELNKLRTQNMLQRERSSPLRWMDINRVDPTIQYSLMKGTWQGFIPTQGAGDKVIGEIARAGMPPEHGVFEAMAKADLGEAWSLGPNQVGSGAGVETKGESQSIEANYQTRISRERAIVGKHFCGISEVLAGLMCLYEDPSLFGEGFDPIICKALSYSILADSTVLLDSNQRLKRLIDFVNFAAKSGFLNVMPVLKEIATLSGLDPNQVIQPPQPKPPVEPSISLRLTGAEDLMNPLTLAFLLKSGQAPAAELVEQAKQLISMVVAPKAPPAPPVMKTNADGSSEPVPVEAPEKGPVQLEDVQLTLAPTPPQAPAAGVVPPNPAAPPVGDAQPDWKALDRIRHRTNDREGGNN